MKSSWSPPFVKKFHKILLFFKCLLSPPAALSNPFLFLVPHFVLWPAWRTMALLAIFEFSIFQSVPIQLEELRKLGSHLGNSLPLQRIWCSNKFYIWSCKNFLVLDALKSLGFFQNLLDQILNFFSFSHYHDTVTVPKCLKGHIIQSEENVWHQVCWARCLISSLLEPPFCCQSP